MKTTLITTLITTFAIAVMVFAFSADPVMAKAGWDSGFAKNEKVDDLKDLDKVEVACSGRDAVYGCSNEAESKDEFGERDVADSGNEGSTSAASAGQ